MEIQKKYKGLSGQTLLGMVTVDGSAVEIDGEGAILIPCTLPFANRGEISSIDGAEYVAIQTRFVDIMVKV